MSIFEPTPTGDEAVDVVFKRLQQAMRGQSTAVDSALAGLSTDIAAGDSATLAVAVTAQQQAQGIFFQTFEDPVEDDWTVVFGPGNVTYPSNGVVGGKAFRTDAYCYLAYPGNIPFDPARLYRFRARIRMVTAPADPAKDNVLFGFVGVAADGTTKVNSAGADSWSAQHYAGVWDMGAYTLGEWQEFTRYFKGAGTYAAGGVTPQTAGQAHANVRYMRPLFILNEATGDGVFEIDYLAIEVITEDPEISATAIADGPALVAANQAASIFGQPFTSATIASLMSGSAITETQIEDNAITTPKIAANQIVAGHINAGEITGDKIAANTLTAANIAAGTITGSEIAAGTILAGNIGANQITSALIAADQILASHIAAGQVDTGELAAGAVTTAKLDALAVEAGNIAAGAITAGKIAAGAINASSIFVSGVVDSAALGTGAVTSNKIGTGAINSGTMIANGVIITSHMTAGSINGDRISASTIDTAQLAAGAVTATKIDALAVTAGKIAAGAVDTNELNALAVTAAKIDSLAVTSDKIAANAIIAGKIAVGGVSGSTQIANGIVNTDQIAANAVIASKINVSNLAVDLNADIGGSLYLPTANNIIWGTSGAPSSISKMLMVPFGQFVPSRDFPTGTIAQNWYFAGLNGYLENYFLTSATMTYVASVVLPIGCVIDSIRLRGYRYNTSGVCSVTLYKVNDSGSVTGVGMSTTHATTGWTTVSASGSETVTTQPYILYLTLKNPDTTSGHESKLAHVRVYYGAANLRESL